MPSICTHCKWKGGSGLTNDYHCYHPSVIQMDYVSGRQVGPCCWTRNKNGDCKNFEERPPAPPWPWPAEPHAPGKLDGWN